jgi:L-asparagine transporter-like permease
MRRWYFWVLAPVMLATAFGLPFLVDPPTWQGHAVKYAICFTLVLATIGLASPARFGWALRGVAAMVLLAYLGYVVLEFMEWRDGKAFGVGSRRSQPNLFNALLGLLVFGVPSVSFLIRGRSGTAVDVLTDDSR